MFGFFRKALTHSCLGSFTKQSITALFSPFIVVMSSDEEQAGGTSAHEHYKPPSKVGGLCFFL